MVFIADVPDEKRTALLKVCYDLHRDVLCKAQLQEIMLANANQVVVDDAPFLEMEYHKTSELQRFAKRAMDIGISAVILIITSPLLAISALAIRLEDGGEVLFRQKRITGNGREFNIYKLRTMRTDASHAAHYVSTGREDPRVTRVGRILRKTRIDELPQFWNILKGDMAVVGPRPEMLDNVAKYKVRLPSFVYREKVKAGLTGYAQIEGKYNTTPEDKLMLDLMYIESFSLWRDLSLILRTLTVFFKKDSTEGFLPDASGEGQHRHTTLLVLAAGETGHYGGNKEIERVGPSGEILMEYSIYDAIEAGFDKVVFVIRQSMAETFRTMIGNKIAQKVEVHYVFQEFDSLPGGYEPVEGRSKPFGTVHAMLAAKDVIQEPFAVINAVDCYGRAAFEAMAQSLRELQAEDAAANMAVYYLKNTLSEYGPVNRGICHLDDEGELTGIAETRGIRRMPDGTIRDMTATVDGIGLDPDALVSMNFWGFTPWIFNAAEHGLEAYLNRPGTDALRGKYVLADLVDELMHNTMALKPRMLKTDSAWLGIAYQEDKEAITRALNELHRRGVYPARL